MIAGEFRIRISSKRGVGFEYRVHPHVPSACSNFDMRITGEQAVAEECDGPAKTGAIGVVDSKVRYHRNNLRRPLPKPLLA